MTDIVGLVKCEGCKDKFYIRKKDHDPTEYYFCSRCKDHEDGFVHADNQMRKGK